MQLLIDIGNTAVKWTMVINGEFQPVSRFYYSAESLVAQLEQNLALSLSNKPTKIFISNVAGSEIKDELLAWCSDAFQIQPYFPNVEKQFHGLVNAYSQPEQLGIDRWLALIAASDCYEMPFCVIDCGTAVTIDAVEDNGQFIGGVILPGLLLMRQSLTNSTEAISTIESEKIENIFANNTKQGVLAGTTYAICALVEAMIKKLQDQTNKEVTCILTGGDAAVVQQYLTNKFKYSPDLVLQGLYLWGKENVLD